MHTEKKNEMRKDGFDKEADQVWLKISEAIQEISKVYKTAFSIKR